MADALNRAVNGTAGGEDPSAPEDRDMVGTFCFVDIAGYTALTDAHGERAAADLVEEFARLIRAAVGAHGTVQELSGDNAFLVFADPVLAMQAMDALYGSIEKLPEFPLLRTGLHHGPALFRANRYFGSTINIAARTAAHAEAGGIVCTAAVAQMLAERHSTMYGVRPLGLFKLKNLPQEFELHRITLTRVARGIAIDPVCQMQVDTHNAAADAWFGGNQYWFCSTACSHRFTRMPTDFV